MNITLRHKLTISFGVLHGDVAVLPDVKIETGIRTGRKDEIIIRCWFPAESVQASWYPNGILVDLHPSWASDNWKDVHAKLTANSDIEAEAA